MKTDNLDELRMFVETAATDLGQTGR